MIIKPVNLPAGIYEDDLVDLADGKLPREREGAVLAAMRANPGLGQMVKRMREDGALLAAMPIKAPAGLAEGVEARLETLALTDLAKAAAATADPVPAPRIEIEEPGPIRFLLENVWMRRLAMAASLAIVSGLAVWGARTALHRSSPGPSMIAENTPSSTEAVVVPEPVVIPAPVDVAVIDQDHVIDMGAVPALAMAPTPAPETISDAAAAKLAREGRLIVTVRAPLAAPTIRRMEGLARGGAMRDAWRSIAVESTPAEYAMLTSPSAWPVAADPTAQKPTPPTTVAGSDPTTTPITVTSGPAPALPKPTPTVKAIYAVEVDPGDEALAGLVKSIRDALPAGATIELRRSPLAMAQSPAMDAESVLWWNASPSRWVKRVSVPVVVEGLE